MAYTEDEKLQIYTEATEPAPCAVHEYYRSLSLLQKGNVASKSSKRSLFCIFCTIS